MKIFDKKIVLNTVLRIIYLFDTGDLAQVIASSISSRVSIEDMQSIISEHGNRVNIPQEKPKYYVTLGENKKEFYVDIRLWIDNSESDLVLRCIFQKIEKDGLYLYEVFDMLAP